MVGGEGGARGAGLSEIVNLKSRAVLGGVRGGHLAGTGLAGHVWEAPGRGRTRRGGELHAAGAGGFHAAVSDGCVQRGARRAGSQNAPRIPTAECKNGLQPTQTQLIALPLSVSTRNDTQLISNLRGS